MYISALVPTLLAATCVSAYPRDVVSVPRGYSINKRAYPIFDEPDQLPSGGEDKLKAALPDAIDLVVRVAEDYDSYSDIWAKYFPQGDHQTVLKVFKQIVSDPSNPGQGEDRLKNARVMGIDFQKEWYGEDICAEGAAAYTSNIPDGTAPWDNEKGVSLTHFCPPAYDQAKIPARYSDIDCNTIGDTVNANMDFLGATFLHEWIHNNAIGAAVTGSRVIDVGGQNGYGPYNTRRMARDTPDQCKNNADSYTWLALEVFWTKLCLKNPRYGDPPQPSAPSCEHAADPSGNAGYCGRFSVEGWCDCGSAGDYAQLEQDDPCAYTAGPQFEPIDLNTDSCGILPDPPTEAECTNYNTPLSDAQNMNDQLNAWGDSTACCTDGSGGCVNIASSGGVAVDLCSESTTRQCIGCARMANYLAGIISSCNQDDKIGGKQDIAENPGLSVQI